MTDELLVERAPDGVATVTFNRPETLNALTFESYRAFRDTFRAFADEPAVRAVVLTGAGDGFCSGGDRRKIVAPLADMGADELLAFTRLTGDAVLAMRALAKPIVAAIGGPAVGAGAVLALAADLRVASERARFGFVFSRLGLSGADMGAAWLLPRIVGLGRASELLLLGDVIDADTADRYGLLSRRVPHGELAQTARALAVRLAEGPALAQGVTKQMLDREASLELADAVEAEARAQAACLAGDAFRAAARRFKDGA